MERGKSPRVGASPDPRRVSTRPAGENGDAGGTHPYRSWVGRGVFHPRPTSIRCVRESPRMERGKPPRVGASPDPRRVSTRQAGDYGDAGGTHPYRSWGGRGVFHPRPTSIRCARESPRMERGKSPRVGASPDPRRVSTRPAGEYGDAGGTHSYRTRGWLRTSQRHWNGPGSPS